VYKSAISRLSVASRDESLLRDRVRKQKGKKEKGRKDPAFAIRHFRATRLFFPRKIETLSSRRNAREDRTTMKRFVSNYQKGDRALDRALFFSIVDTLHVYRYSRSTYYMLRYILIAKQNYVDYVDIISRARVAVNRAIKITRKFSAHSLILFITVENCNTS